MERERGGEMTTAPCCAPLLLGQIGFYEHMRQSFPEISRPWNEAPSVWFSIGFITLFSIVIALFKGIYNKIPRTVCGPG